MNDTRGDDTTTGEVPSKKANLRQRSRLMAAIVGCLALSGIVGGGAAWVVASDDDVADSTPTTTTVVDEVDDETPGAEPANDQPTDDDGTSSGDTSSRGTEGTAESEESPVPEEAIEDVYDGPTIQPQPFGSDGLDADDGFDIRQPAG